MQDWWNTPFPHTTHLKHRLEELLVVLKGAVLDQLLATTVILPWSKGGEAGARGNGSLIPVEHSDQNSRVRHIVMGCWARLATALGAAGCPQAFGQLWL
jgi:hypothetical protein